MTAEHVPPVFPGLLERLQADLGLATRFYTAGLRKPNDLGRLGTELMLRRLSIFLEDISVAPPLSLRRLTVALENVSRGHRQPFLTPVLAHRPRDTRRTTMMKAWAAAAMETLMEGGAKKLNAAEKVARVLVQAVHRTDGEGTRCAECRSQPLAIDTAWTIFAYCACQAS